MKPRLLDGAIEYFEVDQKDVTWIHVSVSNQPNFITLIGTLSADAAVEDTEEPTSEPTDVVPQEVADPSPSSPERYLRIMIPIAVMEGSTKKDVIDYFKGLEDNKVSQEHALDHLGQQLGFDFSKITQDQRDRLLMTLNAFADQNLPLQ